MSFARISALVLVAVAPLCANAQAPLQRIIANDNRTPAGVLRNGVLTLTIEVRDGRWYPEADNGATVPIHSFAEAGKPASTPGPLIRVPEGTEIQLTLRNTLGNLPVRIHGLHTRPKDEDEGVLISAKGTATVRFAAGVPGTYYYWGTTKENGLRDREGPESQLSGAIVIDPRSGSNPADRIFVIGLWEEPARVVDGVEKPFREVLVINGKSWPHTERFNFIVGDTVRWRWVNPSSSTHPMHLHGFYYDVTSRGAMGADTLFTTAETRLVNTELMHVGSTMNTKWVPQKPGNWVFHCHFAFHVSQDQSLEPPVKPAAGDEHAHAGMPHKMAGLVIGVHVALPPGQKYVEANVQRRNLRLLLQTAPKVFGKQPGYGFVLQDGANVPRIDSIAKPGPMLLLRRGEPVRMTVVNNMKEPSAVHWHGIELESFPDGVPDWSGIGMKIMRPIAPKDSFIAEFTPPRSGTFMYHSHLNEGKQMNSGMYGAIIVVDDPANFDPVKDKVVLVGGGGPEHEDGNTPGFVNGSASPPPLRMELGSTYRLRLINIHPDWRVEFTLGNDTTVAKWRPLAKDGADLPASQTAVRSAYLLTGPGETADFGYTPTTAGRLRLQVRTRVSGWNVPLDVVITEPKRTATTR